MATIFERIEKGEIPSVRIHEDEVCFVILDINPVDKGHCLVISRKPFANMQECPDDVLSHMMIVAKKVDARLREVLHCDGSNVLVNNDPASGQEVPHIHIHVNPRFDGDKSIFIARHDKYSEGEMAKYGDMLRF